MIDVIGAIYDLPLEPEGDPVRLWGFHVNVTPQVIADHPHLSSAVRLPTKFRRTWAGDDPATPGMTVALRFNGETAAREALGDLWPAEAV